MSLLFDLIEEDLLFPCNMPRAESIMEKFTMAAIIKDNDALSKLLSETGTFDIQDKNLDTVKVGKTEFLSWFKQKLNGVEISYVKYDTCLHCAIDNRVVIFNHGQFPREIKGSYERSKTGLMLDIRHSKIQAIKFCFVFAETSNQYACEN